jgi:outer membrane protein assembly factor BamD
MSSLAAFLRRLVPVATAITVLAALSVGGCGLLPEASDETAGWSANRLYAEAKEAMADGGYDKAIKYFEKLEARYPYGRYAQQAQLEVAYAYYRQAEPASTIAACDRFIRLHPNHPNVDYAYYLKGLANFNEDLGFLGYVSLQDLTERDPKAARDSFDAFKVLVAKYPESKYTPDATARMKYLVNALASHEVHVARYYMKRGAYVAAVNRAQTAVKTYVDAPANEEALFIMVKAYDLLGMNDLRDDIERVMRRNFPNSEYYVRGLNRAEPWWKLW